MKNNPINDVVKSRLKKLNDKMKRLNNRHNCILHGISKRELFINFSHIDRNFVILYDVSIFVDDELVNVLKNQKYSDCIDLMNNLENNIYGTFIQR